MSGDWIKMRASLCTHPKVSLIAEIIGASSSIGKRLSTGFNGALNEIVGSDVTRDITIASLLRVWCATNEHTCDGVWQRSTLRSIDTAAGIVGFGAAMQEAEWLTVDDEAGTVTLPNFLEYNSPAKGGGRSPAAARQQKYREQLKAKSDVTRDVTGDVTVTPREEKRREEKKEIQGEPRKRVPALVRPDDVDQLVWADWLHLRKTKRAPVTDTVLAGARSEAAKAGMTLEQFLAIWCRRGSQGLEAAWIRSDDRKPGTGETAYQQSQRERVAEFAPGVAKRTGFTNVIEMEAGYVPVIASR